MEVIDGAWHLQGLDPNEEDCIHTSDELLAVIEKVGILPLFSNNISGFSVESMTDPSAWWSGNVSIDPWEWRTVLARTGKVAYGKFFGGRAGFISKKWFPYFANYRRKGYDFDALYEDGKAGYKEKLLMDLFVPSGMDMWDVKPSQLKKYGCASELYTYEMKEKAGFGKGGEKGFDGTLTKLQMETYLITADFRPRLNKSGDPYGWAVAIMTAPEYVWGYKFVTGKYGETPEQSFDKLAAQIGRFYDADKKAVKKII